LDQTGKHFSHIPPAMCHIMACELAQRVCTQALSLLVDCVILLRS